MTPIESFIDLRRGGLSAVEALEAMAPFEPRAVQALEQLKRGSPLSAVLHRGWLPPEGRGYRAEDLDDPNALWLIQLRAKRLGARTRLAKEALWLPLLFGGSSLLGTVVMSLFFGGGGVMGSFLGLGLLLGAVFMLIHPKHMRRVRSLAEPEARLEAATLLQADEAALETLLRYGDPRLWPALKRMQREGPASLGAEPLTRPLARALLMGAQLGDAPARLAKLAEAEAEAVHKRLSVTLKVLGWSWVLWISLSGASAVMSQSMEQLEGLPGMGGASQAEQLEEVERFIRESGM